MKVYLASSNEVTEADFANVKAIGVSFESMMAQLKRNHRMHTHFEWREFEPDTAKILEGTIDFVWKEDPERKVRFFIETMECAEDD